MKSYWFKRLERELPSVDKQLRLVRIKHGFYRIYFKQAYIHEVYEEMPFIGYDKEDYDIRFESQQYFEEFEDKADLTRKIKNYVEGYVDSIDRIRKRIYMFRKDYNFYNEAAEAYQNVVVK